jgi:hypothetical protein
MAKGPAMNEHDMSDRESANPVTADGDDKLHELVEQLALCDQSAARGWRTRVSFPRLSSHSENSLTATSASTKPASSV